MNSTMNIVFMGTSDFSIPALDMLLERGEKVVDVVTRPDRPKGRGRKLAASPVKKFAERKGINIFQPINVKDESFISKLRELKPDIIVVVAFGRILSKEILEIPRFGCVNLHASLLPGYRGAAPINWAIINGENMAGLTTILMDEGLDTGDILLQKEVEIEEDDTAESLHDKMADMGAELLLETLHRLREGSITPVPQNHSQATLVPIIMKEDGIIDWTKDGAQISNLIRGLTPRPGAFTYLHGKIFKIFRCIALKGDSKGITPGTITEIEKEGVRVSTGKGFLLIKEVQLQDHKKMGVADFLRGHRNKITVGTVLG